MNEFQQRANDKTTIFKDIIERKQIINKYQMTGILDRDEAISKIMILRLLDKDLAKATAAAHIATGSVTCSQASNQDIISELQFQIDYLTAKLSVGTK